MGKLREQFNYLRARGGRKDKELNGDYKKRKIISGFYTSTDWKLSRQSD